MICGSMQTVSSRYSRAHSTPLHGGFLPGQAPPSSRPDLDVQAPSSSLETSSMMFERRLKGLNVSDIQCSSNSNRRFCLLSGMLLTIQLGQAFQMTEASAADVASPSALPRTDMPAEEGNVILLSDEDAQNLTLSERQVLLLNQRIQTQNRVATGFPSFIRSGFDVKVIASGYSITPEGIIYKDYQEGTGDLPKLGQEVTFQYTGYNESGAVIDSSYRQGRPAQTQLGVGGLIPGFDIALRTMKVGTQRRFIVPPALGPPVGPSTFFSAKQCEVFNVELLTIKTCARKQSLMFSSVVCE
ncbi:hypothetical protein CEUSTIGMA_g5237.t1 [Chlamydomonas eustigma]|uniref:peptidylprolyl isomerase n=1 Tax=Chlamydomonas eustigma TaxID=1157962 RepID=A0A250X3Y6_9CHLO|nr:hypothetical protein CEUSTIGMA_g5237.t1 [Chlamydomonas eustigma]|eukprot:GAX77794.1 hypothetical protein CEUSTIGMA_g5237.t1 [Chlamydomonas eustigma]